MKNNLSWFTHYVDAYDHPKFVILCLKYGLESEARFWRLNSLIAKADNCMLRYANARDKVAIMAALKISEMEQLDAYISYLASEECQLITIVEGYITNEFLQLDLQRANNTRERVRNNVQKLRQKTSEEKSATDLPELSVTDYNEDVTECNRLHEESNQLQQESNRLKIAHNITVHNSTEHNTTKQNKTEQKKEKEALPQPTLIVPFESDGFKNIWEAWKTYKDQQHKFKYKSVATEQASLNQITQLAKGIEKDAIAIIVQSIGNGWKGFFELKNNTSSAQGNQKRTDLDEYKAQLARNMGINPDAMFGNRRADN
jgi:transcription-repair coupling factor (superfamily II helicase)